MPKVSIYICTFNRAELLREAIQSVLNQTYRDIKVVVLDNASMDHTSDVVSSFDDSRLSYIRHAENIGGFQNWNYALDHADTEYVSIFHDDDRMLPWMVEEEVRVLDEVEEVGIVASSVFCLMNSDKTRRRRETAASGSLFRQNELVEYVCQYGHNPVVCPSVMFRRKDIDALALRFSPDVGFSADLYLWLEANSKGVVVYLSKQPFLEYRIHKAKGTNNNLMTEAWIYTFKRIVDFIMKLGLGYNTQRIGAFCAKHCIMSAAGSMKKQDNLRELFLLRESLKVENGLAMSDDEFQEAILTGVWGDLEFYVIDSWKKHFAEETDRKLAIYGIGKHTEAILECCASDHVLGLMDSTRQGGTIYGKPIISIEEAVALGIGAIIIVAQPSNVQIIYRRISEVCAVNSIDVYDRDGEIVNCSTRRSLSL